MISLPLSVPLRRWCWRARPCHHRRQAARSHSNGSRSSSSGCRCGRCWSCTTEKYTSVLAKRQGDEPKQMHYVTIHQAGQWDDISHSESGLYCGQLGRETNNSKESTYREPVLQKNRFSIPIPIADYWPGMSTTVDLLFPAVLCARGTISKRRM